jgi:chromosomal replication initiator protein
LSSDRPASEITNLEHRLVSRFEWGLTAELQPPDIETRLAILRKKRTACRSDCGMKLSSSCQPHSHQCAPIGGAHSCVSPLCVAQREGTHAGSNRTFTQGHFAGGRAALDHDRTDSRRVAVFLTCASPIQVKRRPASIAFPRQVAMYLARELTKASLNEIGDAFGGRDHGTVLHACKLVKRRMSEQDNIRQTISFIDSSLQR